MKNHDSDFFHRSALHRSAPTEIELGVIDRSYPSEVSGNGFSS